MSEQGRKYDGGKLRYDLIPVLALEETARVVTKGAEKYDDENWKLVPEGRRRYLAAAMRHIQQWRKGEIYDDEMGTHHIANAISNLMFILEKELQGWEDVPEQQDISQEELKEYVDQVIDCETYSTGTMTIGTPSYTCEGAHTNALDTSHFPWCPPVKEGENPWIEHTSNVMPVGEDVRVEVLYQYSRKTETPYSEEYPAWKLCWERYDGNYSIVAYRIVS